MIAHIATEPASAQTDHCKNAMWVMVGLMFSVVSYGLTAFWIVRQTNVRFSGGGFDSNIDWARWAYGSAFLLALAVILLRRALFQPSRLISVGSEGGVNALAAHFTSRTIILGVVCELIALAGFILAVRNRDFEPMWRLGTVSLALMLYVFPRRGACNRILDQYSTTVQDGT